MVLTRLRLLSAWIVLILTAVSLGQTSDAGDLFSTTKPDVLVVVKKHRLGADLVEIRILDPDYPPDLLHGQVDEMCNELGTPARGLQVYKEELGGPKLVFLSAAFGTYGIIEGDGHFALQPIARAFANAPAPFTVHAINVVLVGQEPVTGESLMKCMTPNVEVLGRDNPQPNLFVEYRIHLLTQDPTKIEIPDRAAPLSPPKPVPPPKPPSEWPLWAMFAVAAAALGVLVYLALLKLSTSGSKSPPRSSSHD